MIALLLLQSISGHLDENVLSLYADSLQVPRAVVWAVAYMESRQGRQGNRILGPGVLAYSNGALRRVCREIGRMQISPCGPVPKLFPRCSPASVKAYLNNVWCGVRFLRYLYDRYGTWPEAIWHYNGSRKYLSEAQQYLGSLYLKAYETQTGTP